MLRKLLKRLYSAFSNPFLNKQSVADEPKNEVISREYYIETAVKQKNGHVKAGSTSQYVEYVEGTLKSYRNVLTHNEFWYRYHTFHGRLASPQ